MQCRTCAFFNGHELHHQLVALCPSRLGVALRLARTDIDLLRVGTAQFASITTNEVIAAGQVAHRFEQIMPCVEFHCAAAIFSETIRSNIVCTASLQPDKMYCTCLSPVTVKYITQAWVSTIQYLFNHCCACKRPFSFCPLRHTRCLLVALSESPFPS